MKKIFALLLGVSILTACNLDYGGFKPDPVPFTTHSSVLRGPWAGTFEGGAEAGETLSLNFTPTYVSEEKYSFTATGTLGSESVTAIGTVYGGSNFRYMQPQTSPIPTFSSDFTITRADGSTLKLNCYYNGPAHWRCYKDATTIQLTKS